MPPVYTDNMVGDFVRNLAIVLEDNRNEIGVKKVYDDDVGLIDIFPSVAIGIMNATLQRRTLGNTARFEVDIMAEIWYYHERITADTRRNEVMKAAWDLTRVMQENASVNAWLQSTRAYIRAVTWALRRNADMLLASARLVLVGRQQTTFTCRTDGNDPCP
jgi:hypothetical protein